MSSKFLWKSLLATPALLGAAMIVSSSAIAAEVQPSSDVDALINGVAASNLETATASASSTEAAPLQVSVTPSQASVAEQTVSEAPIQISQTISEQTVPATSDPASLDQIIQYSNEGSGAAQSQVTSISQLSDVQPTDWAFQALQSLVERYGCIAGYPDGTYKGSRAMTRYEFAAGLNACLDRISELIASSTADLATKEDLATLQRLQEEFAAELATLRGRVDSLEARVTELEANQFSTTTKLKGETIFAVGIPIDGDEDAFTEDQVNAGYRVRLNFDTSFTGEDLLRARLQARDFDNFNSFGGSVGATQWNFSSDAPGNGSTNGITLDDLYYRFPLGSRAQITIGANSFSDTDLVSSSISPFDSGGFGSLTGFGKPAQYYFLTGDAGVGTFLRLSDNVSLDLAYSAGEPDNPNPGNGLFNGDYSAVAQLTFLSDFVDAALTYGNSYRDNGFFGLGGPGDPEVANTYGGQVNFKFGAFQLGGGIAYVPVRRIGVGDYDVWSYQATLAFPDLGGEGNLLGILAGITPYAAGVPDELSGPINQDNAFLVEGFYRFNVNDNISITPGLIWISNPGNNSENSDTFIGAIRTTFSF
jgi:hypothetical protein